MRRVAAIAVLVSGIAAAPAARAGDELVSPMPSPQRSLTPPDDGDYGWQVVVADLAGLGSTLALLGFTGSEFSVLPWLLAAPTVHAVHGDAGSAGLSLVLNAGLPPAGMLLGWASDGHGCGGNSEGCGGLGIFIGLIVGVGAAIGLDAALLSHPGSTTAPAPQTPTVGVSPSFAFAPDGRFSFGLSGRF